MKVQVTKKMAGELNKALKGKYGIERISFTKVPFDAASVVVSYDKADWIDDVDWADDAVKVLKVEYLPECYACSQYVTTKQLRKLFMRIEEKTLESFIKAFAEAYEV